MGGAAASAGPSASGSRCRKNSVLRIMRARWWASWGRCDNGHKALCPVITGGPATYRAMDASKPGWHSCAPTLGHVPYAQEFATFGRLRQHGRRAPTWHTVCGWMADTRHKDFHVMIRISIMGAHALVLHAFATVPCQYTILCSTYPDNQPLEAARRASGQLYVTAG